jgi:Na+/proline symporter
MILEYITIGIYILVLVFISLRFSRFSKTAGDYIRAGGQAVWWVAGMSIVTAGISAFTFTGNGSAAFSAGPTFLAIYIANIVATAIGALFLAGWFRQTRGHTQMDIVRARFGPAVEQFALLANLLLNPMAAAIQLWALGVFASTAFKFPLVETIVVLGAVVVFYSTIGGKWSVMAADFVQGLVLFPITILMAFLALRHIGGIGEFFGCFSNPQFSEDFKIIKSTGQFPDDKFTWKWVIVIFAMQLYSQISLTQAGRYLTVKDGREARRAAWLACALLVAGTLVWFIPPMVARFMHAAEVAALPGANPAESAYAFLSIKLLPNGLLGVMIAAMFSATLSSMDAGLNEQAGIVSRNLVPRVREWLRLVPLSPGAELRVCRLVTLALGLVVIAISLALCTQDKFILFDAYLVVGSTVGIPLAFPLLAGLWVKRLPRWGYLALFGACILPSLWALYDTKVNGAVWTIQDRAMWIFIFGIAATLLCIPFYRRSPVSYKEKVDVFFKTMRTPVDFEKEIGESRDFQQLRLLGRTVTVMGGLLALLLLLPNDAGGRGCILFVAGATAVVGLVLLFAARRREKRTAKNAGADDIQAREFSGSSRNRGKIQ